MAHILKWLPVWAYIENILGMVRIPIFIAMRSKFQDSKRPPHLVFIIPLFPVQGHVNVRFLSPLPQVEFFP